MIVTLDQHEMRLATFTACERQIENLRDGRKDAHGLTASDERGWFFHVLGACGELAVAKALNLFWSGNMGKLHLADVGRNIQVRTRSKDWYDLMLHPRDPDHDVFLLVTGSPPRLHIRGWIFGGGGKQQEFWKDPAGGRPAFFVPQDRLWGLGTLPGAKASA